MIVCSVDVSDLSGLVIQKAFKSFGQIEAAFVESSRLTSKKMRRGILATGGGGGSGDASLTQHDLHNLNNAGDNNSDHHHHHHHHPNSSHSGSSRDHEFSSARPSPISGAAAVTQHALR